MRVTQRMIDLAQREVTGLLSEAAGKPVAVTLHRGNGTYKIHNVLIVNNTNVWSDGRAGTTARECYNALRTMTAALAVVIENREGWQSVLARVPDWDCETIAWSLSDCKHWDKPGTECAGPRVGMTPAGVILCERHYNEESDLRLIRKYNDDETGA